MTPQALSSPPWLTASFGETTHTTPMELHALGEHLSVCRRHSGRWFTVKCGAEAVNGFVSAHLVTTLAGVSLLLGLTWLVA